MGPNRSLPLHRLHPPTHQPILRHQQLRLQGFRPLPQRILHCQRPQLLRTPIFTFTPTNTPLPTATATGASDLRLYPNEYPVADSYGYRDSNLYVNGYPIADSHCNLHADRYFHPNADRDTIVPDIHRQCNSYVREGSAIRIMARIHNYGWTATLAPIINLYLKFTVSGITGTVQSATLRVYSTSCTVDGPTVYATTNDWTETGITGNTRPALTSSGLDDSGAIARVSGPNTMLRPSITGDGTYSFAFIPTSTDAVSFSAREGSQPPQLVLTIAP